RYYTPSGKSIQVTGVTPDITVDDTAQGNLFRLPREADLQRHLVNGNVDESTLAEQEEETVDLSRMFEFGGNEDYQLQQAINFLEGRPVQRNNPELVAKAKAERDARKEAASAATPAEAVGVPVPPEKMEGAEKKSP